ncbi:hypothetical protein FHT60_000094 [Novosphingobium sp. BK486]|nr:hypothetical protein [Novosphingobium sp. BK256]MBB3373450.1 hypothetical protein [Novosphingobium sp. BK280]MBB3377819.1 hypothetical protein [Novosphingobium sp. BK258]MBB3418770.1 hypothetical protein [Novosphingobium sp. BK267]MBB3450395.1 hypothetical protein [Novosphingobium sp. BK352]MBB3476735.1 hypothetical protein [Novosphingobium sp. BK369]MBB3499252.1 hypothetical protein [Novosphingobium sp. BK336]MBB3535037.1 hypothetical protein [Novosphingobium sp. BK486]MBB3554434.1 hypo
MRGRGQLHNGTLSEQRFLAQETDVGLHSLVQQILQSGRLCARDVPDHHLVHTVHPLVL